MYGHKQRNVYTSADIAYIVSNPVWEQVQQQSQLMPGHYQLLSSTGQIAWQNHQSRHRLEIKVVTNGPTFKLIENCMTQDYSLDSKHKHKFYMMNQSVKTTSSSLNFLPGLLKWIIPTDCHLHAIQIVFGTKLFKTMCIRHIWYWQEMINHNWHDCQQGFPILSSLAGKYWF